MYVCMHALYHTCTHTNMPCARSSLLNSSRAPVLPPKITEVDTFSVEAGPDSPEAKVSVLRAGLIP